MLYIFVFINIYLFIASLISVWYSIADCHFFLFRFLSYIIHKNKNRVWNNIIAWARRINAAGIIFIGHHKYLGEISIANTGILWRNGKWIILIRYLCRVLLQGRRFILFHGCLTSSKMSDNSLIFSTYATIIFCVSNRHAGNN